MRLREVFRFEIEYSLRRPSTWIYAAFLFGMAFLVIHANTDSDIVQANSPESLAELAVMVGMFGMLVTAALFGDAAVRDVQVGMDALLFTSPLGKAEYLGGRFLAALAVNAVLLLAIPLGQAAATVVPYLDPAKFGPFRVGAYLQPYLLFLLPDLVLVGAILFAFATLARQVIPAYLGAIGLFIGYLIAASYWDQIANPMLAALVDPLGLVSLEQVTRYWTAAERNSRLVGSSALLIWNRVVWLAIGAAVLVLLVRRFRFAHADGGGRRRKWRETVAAPTPERTGPVAVPRVAGSFGVRTRVRQTLAVARRSLAEVVGSPGFVVVLLGCAGLTLLMGWNVGETVFDTSTWPVTLLVAETVQSERIVPIIGVLIVLYAGELVWKEREVSMAEIADATPVPEGTALFGRFLALVGLITMIQLAIMLGGILIQAFQGYYDFEVGLYLRILFGLNLADYVLLAALAMTMHVVVNHKYIGHIFVLLVFASPVVLQQLGIVRHHLLLYGTDPGWTYSDMNGFGPFIGPFVWFKLYWAGWALLLAVVAVLFWVRGREPGVRRRLLQARARFTGSVARAAGAAIVLIVALGGFIFYNTNVLNEYLTPDERGAPQAEYEKRYARYANVAQPTIIDAELRVEIYPDEPAVDLRGSYRLVNRTDAPIDSVHVYIDSDIQVRSVSVDRAATPVLVDDEVGYRILALERALAPGDSLQVAFDVAWRPRGFPNSGIQTAVVSNGAYFNRSWMPIIGYQPAFELSGDEARHRFGLGPQPPLPGPDDAEAKQYRQNVRDADVVHVDAVVGTAADQIAVTPGVLHRSWTENGRRYFHYESEVPITFGSTIVSARYAVLEDRWNRSAGSGHAVELRIYHHPSHNYVLDRMVRSMKASLDYYTENFGPYPYRQLSILEIPRYGGVGHAHPHTIGFTEDVFFARHKEGEFDQTFFGAAHEIAHQWWGGQVRGALVRGAAFLSESLANYSAMMVTEETYGLEAVRIVYDFQMDRYLRQRGSLARDVPLLEVTDQPWIFYGKGAVAMYALREYIGEAAVNTALRRYLEKHRDGKPPYPTTLDLYAELRAVTPDSLQYVLTDLFETVTLWDVKAERAVVEPTGTGEYVVTMDVVAKKMRADSVGNETEVPMNDIVDVGVFAAGEGDWPGEPLYLERHRIRSGAQTIRITVPREPARAGIDPYRKLIDRARNDNVVEVSTSGAQSAAGAIH